MYLIPQAMELVLDVPFDDRYEYFCNYDPTCSYLCNAMRVADAYRHCHAIALNTARVLAMRVHCTTKTVQVYRLFAAWYQSLWHICTATGECFVLVSTKQGLIWGYAAISCWEWTDDMYEEGLVPAAFLVQTSQYSLLLLQLERHATLQHLNHVPVKRTIKQIISIFKKSDKADPFFWACTTRKMRCLRYGSKCTAHRRYKSLWYRATRSFCNVEY